MKVAVISTSPNKEKEAIEHLGADAFVVSRDEKQMQSLGGAPAGSVDQSARDQREDERKLLAGNLIGGLKETQEMIDLAAEHSITADVEVISMDYVNTAMDRLAKNDVRYRFVIDVGNTLEESA
ncbi:hypothetical protein ACLOJK_003149 [Asimina triloba]